LNLRNVPIGMYGAVMGLTGLGLTARAAATVLPGYVRAPAYVTEPWVALGVLTFAVLVPLYIAKLARHPDAVREEFTNPVQLGFCGALPVGMFLVGGGLAPYWFALGDAIWWIGFAMLLAFQIWALTRWLSGSIDLAHINAGWLIIMVGGIVAPGPGIALGHAEASRFIFGISAAAAPILMALLFYRAIIGAPLPERLRPSWFILLVPPSLIYANGLALYPGSDILEPLYPFSLALAAALLIVSRDFLRWPYGPPWWAFTFPLDALAYAAARYAQDHPAPLWKAAAALTLLLAAAFVVLALVKSVAALPLAAGRHTPRSGASPPE
jgi:tellurite resistance protein